MRNGFLFILVLCVMLGPARVPAQTIAFSDLLKRPLPVATIRLAYGNDPNQFGELWVPEGDGLRPVLVMIHGGCWQASLPGTVLMDYIADDMRKSGFAVWNVEYRRLGKGGGYPDTFLDIADSLDYLRAIAAPYRLDLTHVTVIGHSAGGHLALWAAARDHLDRASPLYKTNPLPISSAISLSGIDDLKAYHDRGPSACGGPDIIDQLVDRRGRPGQDVYADTSPAALLPLHVPQLIVAGSLDPIVPPVFARDYAALAAAKNDSVKLLEIQGAGHFELIDPASSAWAQIKQNIKAR